MPKPIDNATAAFHEECRIMRAQKDLNVLALYKQALRIRAAAENVVRIARSS